MGKHQYSSSVNLAIILSVLFVTLGWSAVDSVGQDSFRANVALPDGEGSSVETPSEPSSPLPDRPDSLEANLMGDVFTLNTPNTVEWLDVDTHKVGPVPMCSVPEGPVTAISSPEDKAATALTDDVAENAGSQADSTDDSIIESEKKENTAEIVSPWENQNLGRRHEKPGPTPKTERNQSSLPSVWRTLVSLLIVLVLIASITYLFKRFCLNRRGSAMPAGVEILARSSVNPKQSLCLVQLGNRLVLLGQSPNHISALQTIDDPDEITQIMGQLEQKKTLSITNTFDKLFHREKDLYETDENPVISLDLEEDQGQNTSTQPWNQARGELSSLLDKVKGLSKIRFHS